MTRTHDGGHRQALPALLILAIAGCTSTTNAGANPTPGHAVNATESEFKIETDTTSIGSGSETFTVTNHGTVAHEFVIVRTDLAPDALPRDGSGGVDEEAEGTTHITEVEDVAPGSSTSLTANLAPGRYVVFCNVPGHYAGGMHASLTVVANG